MVNKILSENQKRLKRFDDAFNPLTGFHSIGDRVEVSIPDFPIPQQWIPRSMLKVSLVKKIINAGTIAQFIEKEFPDNSHNETFSAVVESFTRLRCQHDFPFWAYTFTRILSKYPGEGEIPFSLSFPQRKLISLFEDMRTRNLPIRVVLLKARQWGGSTATQLYMAWLQLVHKFGLNSVIVSQAKKTSFAIKAMLDRTLNSYPIELLYPQGESFNPKEKVMENVGLSGDYKRIPQRDCTITVASYESPDALRGDAYSLVHCSEVALWSPTDMKSPESVVRSACSGVLLAPFTMVVLESTANGTGNFFHSEYQAAADPDTPSQYSPLFIPWYDIEQYSLPFKSQKEKKEFAEKIYNNRLNDYAPTKREEPGKYLWWLWNKGASLEAINWYVHERAGKNDHAVMAAEYPSDDVEAFVHSGSMVFDKYKVEEFKKACRPPRFIGEIQSSPLALNNKNNNTTNNTNNPLKNLRFIPDTQGHLWIWSLPDSANNNINNINNDNNIIINNNTNETITDRYLTVVDIGGRSDKADWSVIAVFDRINMIDGDRPSIVAQWRGHDDIDRIAWKAAQIAAFYDNSLLVIESNTLETHDKQRQIEGGDQSLYVLSQIADVYPNLYARRQSEDEIRQKVPRKYGFHTNISTKPMVISTLVKVVRDHLYTERDERALAEFLEYECKQNGSYGAVAGKHDDILMTRAIGLHICFHEMPIPRIIQKTKSPKPQKRKKPLSEASF
ncbi:MAG: terminase [Muribaculaceae bacterium]|nr:terminase [Muribaculaceae bacterium]